jgi:hypothetical protein
MDGLIVGLAAFEDAHALKCAVLSVVQKNGFKIEDLTGEDNLDKILSLALSVDNDKGVYDALWPCLMKCTYKKEKITKATFDDAEMRAHYFPIAAKCIEENLSPFIVGLRSLWVMFLAKNPQEEALK